MCPQKLQKAKAKRNVRMKPIEIRVAIKNAHKLQLHISHTLTHAHTHIDDNRQTTTILVFNCNINYK